jgi:ketosteroid isomerase-like protein
MKLYASDGVFMPHHSPSSVDADAVRKAYDAAFDAITLDVDFEVAEIRQIAPDWAFARTNSAGKVKINATGDSGPEANQDL